MLSKIGSSLAAFTDRDTMDLFRPSPNPPGKPKACQSCGALVDGSETTGWWLERENWQSTNEYVLFCMSCCVEKMNESPIHPNVDDEQEAREVLRDEG